MLPNLEKVIKGQILIVLGHQIEDLFNIIVHIYSLGLVYCVLGSKVFVRSNVSCGLSDPVFAIFLTVEMTVSDKKLLGTCEIYEYLYTILCPIYN